MPPPLASGSKSGLAGSRTRTDDAAKIASADTSRPSAPADDQLVGAAGCGRVAPGEPDDGADSRHSRNLERMPRFGGGLRRRLVDEEMDPGRGELLDGRRCARRSEG